MIALYYMGQMKGAPRSKHFDDVYFSAQDGLAETRHVFLQGNNLPHAWQGRGRLTIAETGFGTGLNLCAVAHLFETTRAADQYLEFISVEKYPLSAREIQDALAPWREDFSFRNRENDAPGNMLDRMVRMVAECDSENGIFGSLTNNITLRIEYNDVNTVLPVIGIDVDAWFLDGFKPSGNPDMWSDLVLENVARTTISGGTFATFTAAGFVRRSLQNFGFEVEKIPGFGRKREMLVGRKK